MAMKSNYTTARDTIASGRKETVREGSKGNLKRENRAACQRPGTVCQRVRMAAGGYAAGVGLRYALPDPERRSIVRLDITISVTSLPESY